MEKFLTGISLAFVSALAWLSLHYPRFATILLCILLAVCLLLHIGVKIYRLGWIDSTSLMETIISRTLSSIDSSKKKQVDKTKDLYNAAFKCSLDRIKTLTEKHNHIFYMAYGIILGLLIFCIVFPRYQNHGL